MDSVTVISLNRVFKRLLQHTIRTCLLDHLYLLRSLDERNSCLHTPQTPAPSHGGQVFV